MKVLIVHNYYQHKGGEDSVVANEVQLLRKNGVEVLEYYRHNSEINTFSAVKKISMLSNTAYAKDSYRELSNFIEKHKPDICHVHNFFPLITTAVYGACKAHGVPVVQTLHNYRLACLNGMFIRENKACEDCVTGSLLLGVARKCYRDSFVQSYAVANMVLSNKRKGVWNSMVDRYLTFTEFSKEKFMAIGIDEQLLTIKPNFVDVQPRSKQLSEVPTFVYLGRLDESKGINVLLEAALELKKIQFKIIGKDTEGFVEKLNRYENVEYLGEMPHEDAMIALSNAHGLVFPSLCYEGMPMTILEAFALRTTVIASNMGAMKSVVKHEKNGLLFSPGSGRELAHQITRLLEDSNGGQQLVENAHSDYISLYSETSAWKQLKSVYTELLNEGTGS